jgi:hypothetical protein
VEAVVEAPGDDERMEAGLALGSDPQDPAAPRGVGPFVEVGRVVVDAERRDVDGDGPGRVRAVYEDADAPLAAPRRDLADGDDERAFRGHVVDEREARPGREGARDRVHERTAVPDRIGDRDGADRGPVLAGHEGRGVGDGPVRVIGHHDLVAGRELERAEDGVGARGRVVHEHEVVAAGAQELRDRVRRLPHAARSAVGHADPAYELA